MRVTITEIKEMKQRKEKIPMLTAYDYVTAKIVDEAGVPLILVGDSLGMVILGYETTIPVTMEEMLHHTKAVVRGARRALIVADMPFMTYHISVSEALRNAARFIQEGGAQAVKLEGGKIVAETVKRIVDCGIPVMAHIGVTPQSIYQLGGYKVQGKTPELAKILLKDARILGEAGAFSLVLECVPAPLARVITQAINIPTIGIGAGPDCDGQVQVISDILGLFTEFVPKHAKQYAKLASEMKTAVANYVAEVKSHTFPTMEHSFPMDESLLKSLETTPSPSKGED
ncbi:MAG: 3-methyl-2-oxobutanoate hydroxymethyltransferase [Chloroflexi bacterium CG08_land_8_20_14_0_20_45_12]|nr:MAG: 3-methyl-2-oxobutanoate hydroxymethyltransferase [Chloroflexi bacterium CG08_land_8_20_14_0_20_45_12]